MRLTSALVSLALASFAFAPAALAVDTTIRGVDYDAERGVIVVHGAGGLRILTTRLDHPNRLVIDFPGSHFARTFQSLDGIPGTGIVRVRVGQYQSTITRVVLDMSQFSEFKPVSVGQDVLIPVRANADTRAETPVAAAPSPEPEPAAVPEAPEMPTISAIRYRQGRIEVQMDRRAPYWSHVSKGSPTVYSLHFPHVRLSRALDGSSHTINSFGIFRWEAHQDGDTARIDIPMSKTPDFRIDAGVTSWTFASDMPVPVAARPAPRHDEPDAPATPRWAKTTEAPLTLKRVGDQWFMAIHADGRFRFRTTRVGDDRLHLDIAGARVALPRDSVYIDSGLIARVRTQPMGSTTRLTIDLDQAVRHTARMIGDGSTLLLTLSRVSKDQITVDPGHGGTDEGALGTKGTREKDVTLAIATRLTRIMEANGMSVQMTRMKDLEVLLRPRVDMANRNDSDVFISIHANSFGKFQGVSGIETYYFTDESAPLARAIHRQLIKTLKRPDRGVRKNNFYVVHHTKMPSALVEIGYLSNPEEEALLATPAYQERAAQAIYAGIKDYLASRKSKH